MILLWLIVAVFSALVMAMLMFPLLLRNDDKAEPDRAEYDMTVYRDQLSEIDRDLARGLLSEEQAAAARLEVQRRMLAAAGPDAAAGDGDASGDVGSGTSQQPPIRFLDLIPRAIEQGPWGIATLAGVLAVVPMGALALYLIIGSPMLPGQPHAQRIAQVEQESLEALPAELRNAIETLRAVVEQRPEDAQAWFELGRAYRRAEQHARAVNALEKARDLGVSGPTQATVLAELGESLLLSQEGRVSAHVRTLFLDALREDRTEPRARFYLGMAAAQEGDPVRALAIWRDLVAGSPANAPWLGMVRQSMAMVAQQNEIPPATVKPAHPLDLEDGAPVERVEAPAPDDDADTAADAATDPPSDDDGAADTGAEGDDAAEATGPGSDRPAGLDVSPDERAMIEGMVDGLAARLEENPEDVDGWLRLAKSYGVLGRWDEAVVASARAVEQAPDEPDILEHHADVLIAAGQASGATEPPDEVFGLFAKILEIEPDNPKALYFVGLGAARAGDVARARTLWQQLLDRIPADQPARAAIQRQLDSLPEREPSPDPEPTQ
ncbi:c-type cytochrome biogenesis protein CcmI [Roseospira marina]|uniref:C-type cytochrome biogenesis protein CcmI n=1 Tax=Roseospira marina TaxID=140057 RepID=A0A5M6IA01_9PROT|nr:c-type cytochrome biogenesis protein CcmI [Roseospira marina]KAA5605094.1 c-type cytochrome biogenesis protein CcmI [Roseospira marina]MBB4314842.1 cytochrome c-type biogenesis protein CcmH [Roseospira marina]MBB5087842.1 cytochrome c-type biogenesis protein CcmH [Roseospira marina]